jgi:hypothetical protein
MAAADEQPVPFRVPWRSRLAEPRDHVIRPGGHVLVTPQDYGGAERDLKTGAQRHDLRLAERSTTVRLRAPARGQRAAPDNRAVGVRLRGQAGAGMRGEKAKDGRREQGGRVHLFDPPKYTPGAGFAWPPARRRI